MDEETKEELTRMGFLVYQGEYSEDDVPDGGPVVFMDVGLTNLPSILNKLGVLEDYKAPLFLPSLIIKNQGVPDNHHGLFKYMLMDGVVESAKPPKLMLRDLDPVDTIKISIWDKEKERINAAIKAYLESKLIRDRKEDEYLENF